VSKADFQNLYVEAPSAVAEGFCGGGLSNDSPPVHWSENHVGTINQENQKPA
jgi:hypothetical protein